MVDLRVSYDRLEESSKSLQSIEGELENTKDHQGDIKGSLGSGDVAHGMSDFAGNWDYHRHKILDKLKSMREMAEQTMNAFKDADKKLADGLKQDGGK